MQPTDVDNEDVPPMVRRLQARGTPWNKMAVIYRASWMGKAAFLELQKAGVPVAWANKNSSSNFDPLSPSIKLMTMHASKGLKFPVVSIPGLGHLPNRKGTVADEARLLYVAMTRAIEMLVPTGDRRYTFVDWLKGALTKTV